MNFKEIKSWFSNIIADLLNLLESIGNDIETDDNIILKSLLCKLSIPDFKNRNLLKNLQMVEREKMKCFVFGKTSNGKSTVINALLKNKVLPASKGRTTSCFIKIEGCDNEDGYLLDTQNEKQPLELINKLANELNSDALNADFMMEVFLPKNTYPLLCNDVSIFDSPGVDYSTVTDNWINKFCEDADIFLLIVDGDSTLNESERKFFVKVQNIISKPKIFVLVNKWEEDEENVKKQHYDTISNFLIKDLKVYDEETVSEYIYFVSARLALEGTDDETFDKFSSHLMIELSTNAIKTKFQPHIDTILDKLSKVNDFINQYSENLIIGNELTETNISTFETNIHKLLDEQFEDILLKTGNLITKYLPQIKPYLQKMVEENLDIEENLINLLEVKFPKCISKYFRRSVLDLENLLKPIFLKRSIYKNYTNAETETYLFHGEYFKDISKQYDELISKNIEESSRDIRNLFKNQENKKLILERIKIGFNVVNQALQVPGLMLLPILPRVAMVANACAIAANVGAQLIPTISSESISNKIFEEICSFYISITKYFIKECHQTMKVDITKSIEHFISDQKELYKLYWNFQNVKKECQRIEMDVKNKKDELEQL